MSVVGARRDHAAGRRHSRRVRVIGTVLVWERGDCLNGSTFTYCRLPATARPANESDCGENVSDPDDRVSGAKAVSIIDGDGDIGTNWPEISWAADLAQAPWRKSSRSASNGNCVEVAALHDQLVGVRDSRQVGQGPVLVFDGAAWRSFIDSVKNGI
jgi:hypothetical protein